MSQSNNKIYYKYEEIHSSVQNAALLVTKFKPDYYIAISGGGLIPARMLRTVVNVPILTVCMKLYDDTTNQPTEMSYIQWLDQSTIDKLVGKRVMIIDEVDDTRTTIYNCVERFLQYNLGALGVFVVHNKIKPKKVDKLQDGVIYIAAENIEDRWIVYPWDSNDIVAHNELSSLNK